MSAGRTLRAADPHRSYSRDPSHFLGSARKTPRAYARTHAPHRSRAPYYSVCLEHGMHVTACRPRRADTDACRSLSKWTMREPAAADGAGTHGVGSHRAREPHSPATHGPGRGPVPG